MAPRHVHRRRGGTARAAVRGSDASTTPSQREELARVALEHGRRHDRRAATHWSTTSTRNATSLERKQSGRPTIFGDAAGERRATARRASPSTPRSCAEAEAKLGDLIEQEEQRRAEAVRAAARRAGRAGRRQPSSQRQRRNGDSSQRRARNAQRQLELGGNSSASSGSAGAVERCHPAPTRRRRRRHVRHRRAAPR